MLAPARANPPMVALLWSEANVVNTAVGPPLSGAVITRAKGPPAGNVPNPTSWTCSTQYALVSSTARATIKEPDGAVSITRGAATGGVPVLGHAADPTHASKARRANLRKR